MNAICLRLTLICSETISSCQNVAKLVALEIFYFLLSLSTATGKSKPSKTHNTDRKKKRTHNAVFICHGVISEELHISLRVRYQ